MHLFVAFALGIPGNILSAIVWLRRHVTAKNSSAIYLAALAINDLVYLLINLIASDILGCGLRGSFCLCLWYPAFCTVILEHLFVLGFSTERMIAIVRPLQVCLSIFVTNCICVVQYMYLSSSSYHHSFLFYHSFYNIT